MGGALRACPWLPSTAATLLVEQCNLTVELTGCGNSMEHALICWIASVDGQERSYALRRRAAATKAIPRIINSGANQGILRSATRCRLRMATIAAPIRSTIPIRRTREGLMIHVKVRKLRKNGSCL